MGTLITKNRSSLLAVTCSLALVIAACGGGGSGDDGSQTNGEQTPQATLIPNDPLPTVEGRNVTSLAKGYSVTYPEGWETKFNLVNAPTQKLDAFFAPPPTAGGFRATIALTCEQIGGSETSRTYYERKRLVAESFADTEIIGPEQTSLGGVEGFKIEYRQSLEDGSEVQKIDIFAANKSCGYTVSLTSSPDDLAEHLPAWQEFLNTLALI